MGLMNVQVLQSELSTSKVFSGTRDLFCNGCARAGMPAWRDLECDHQSCHNVWHLRTDEVLEQGADLPGEF